VLTAASDYSQYSVTAPADPRLPGGGGYVVSGFFDVNPNKAGQINNLTELDTETGGNQIRHWNGVDVTGRARLRGGAQLSGGVSMGRQTDDICQVKAIIPEVSTTSTDFCRQDQKLQTQVKFSGAYTLPKVGVLVSGSFQSVPGPQITATNIYPGTAGSAVALSLGRPLSSNATIVNVGIVAPQSLYGERLNQLDLRFGKVLRLDRLRMTPSIEIYNALNIDTVLTQSNTFANWQQAQTILAARFVRFSFQFDF
jgi:hypothetical protein